MVESNDNPAADREWLVNQIAHALRNPIFAATVQTEALQLRAHDPQGVAKTVESLHGQLQRLSTSIDEMLLFGRPIRANLEDVSVANVFNSLVMRYSNGDRQEPAQVTVNQIDPGLTGRWDRNVVVVIIERLLDNAVQHTEAPHEILLTAAAAEDDMLELTVSDRGAGISPEIIERAHLPFYPQHSGRPGLGLAIADKFARFLGGWIEIESEEGSGTTARCVLPLHAELSTGQ